MLTIDTPIHDLKGIGEARAAAFSSLGIFTVGDLLYFFPRRYENRGKTVNIADVVDGELCSLIVQIDSYADDRMSKNGLSYTKVTARDDSGFLELVFFNQRWISKSLTPGRTFRVFGRVSKSLFGASMVSPVIESVLAGKTLKNIYPVYPLCNGLTQKIVSDAVNQILPLCEPEVESGVDETLSVDLINQFGLISKKQAIKIIQAPEDEESLLKAKRTFAFEELLSFRLALARIKKGTTDYIAPAMEYKGTGVKRFFESLPFELTNAQERVVKEIFADLCKNTPMMRLVQGDVGSGKTVIAAAAIYFTVKNGMQAAMMAPTEILATQHFATLQKLLSPFGIRVALLTGSMKQKEKEAIKAQILSGDVDVCVGTHALIQGDVVYRSLGLSVTDEQHRFGVVQRATLLGKSENDRFRAHTLVMSATPIPRTLSLILYGDLDVSIIDELPPGRQKIETRAVTGEYREKIYDFIKKQIALGHQAYIICPLVEENEELPRKAVEQYADDLRAGAFKNIKVGFIHGRLTPKEKDREMSDFASGKSKVLVSTTVVEVGVDVPNATVMLIENAECFGLSQLHQLRGRIGRGKAKSFCILLSDAKSANTKERLEIMVKSSNGFEIAEADLKQRGPGDFFGNRQSGEIIFKCADITDMSLLAETANASELILPLIDTADYKKIKDASDNFIKNTLNGKTLN